MTLGEYRVGIDFNPSSSPDVDSIKQAAAALIDLCHTNGYVYDRGARRWNFRWQEKSENSSECATRIGLPQIGNARSKISSRRNSLQIVRCPHCGKEGRLPPMKRWHFDKCRGNGAWSAS